MSTQAHWQDVYTKKSVEEVSWYQDVPTRSVEWIRACTPDRASPILDVGAGASSLVDHLLDDGYQNLGILDLAPSALSAVQHRLGDRAALIEWFVSDVLDFVPPHSFALWHDRAVLHFLVDEQQRRRYAEVLRHTVQPGGHALIATFALGGPTRCSGLEVVRYDCRGIADLLGGQFTYVRDEQELHRTPGGAEQRFQYCLFARRAA
jgi:SAM-dependent methyltransferase